MYTQTNSRFAGGAKKPSENFPSFCTKIRQWQTTPISNFYFYYAAIIYSRKVMIQEVIVSYSPPRYINATEYKFW